MINIKTKVKLVGICVLSLLSYSFFGICRLYAQQDGKLAALSKQIAGAKTSEELYAPFEELKGLYFQDNRYPEFISFLKTLSPKDKNAEPFVNYYIALGRYQQLKHLEETQGWDEYFNQGNAYRDEITSVAEQAIAATTAKDALNIYTRMLLWQFHKDQQDVFAEQALSDLMSSVLEYAKEAKDLKPIKEAANKLLSYNEKGKSRELSKIYVDKLLASEIKDSQLESTGREFYQEGNLELAEAVYDAYIERLVKSTPKEKFIPLLVGIAKMFSYKDEGFKDMLYAEKVFQEIEQIGGKDIFDAGLIYLRAFNLEKAKDYTQAKDLYLELAQRDPANSHNDEALFKAGLIYTYILRDIKSGRGYFEKLALKDQPSPQAVSSLYQLGLLSQWEGDANKAREYYNQLIQKAGAGFSDSVDLAKERLSEIEAQEALDYNLKMFLDVSLKQEYAAVAAANSGLRSSLYNPKKGQEITVTAEAYMPETGCIQLDTEYLWSGHLGKATPSPAESYFNTAYASAGTKEIGLVVVSPAGVLERSLDLLDIN